MTFGWNGNASRIGSKNNCYYLQEKGDIRKYGCYGAVKIHVHGTKAMAGLHIYVTG